MSIFGMIKDAIWGKAAAAPAPEPAAAETAEAPAAAPAEAHAAPTPVDVTALLDQLESTHDQQLNWRTSIVDLMKLLGLDSSLSHREQLATELGYTGELDGSVEMNMWLHKEVMTKLAENGGTVPAELTR